MLAHIGILDKGELEQVEHAIGKLLEEEKRGIFKIENQFEDVHSKIEHELTQRIGTAGKKYILHAQEMIKFWWLCSCIIKII